MSVFKIVLCIASVFALIVLSFALGTIYNDIPYIRFNNELKLYEVLYFFLTLTIGFSVPFLVKKLIDDNRGIKSIVIDDVKDLIKTLSLVKEQINQCHLNNQVSKENKDAINYIFHTAELKLNSVTEQLSISFYSDSNKINAQIKEKYHNYKDHLTGGIFMTSSFDKVDQKFLREHDNEFSKIETYLKTVIHIIHKL